MTKQTQNPFMSLLAEVFEFSELELGMVTDQIEQLGDEVRPAFNAALQRLTPRQERVLRLLHGFGCEPMSMAAIARQWHVSHGRIRTLRNKAHKRMREVAVRGLLARNLIELGVESVAFSEATEKLLKFEEVERQDLSSVRLFGRDHSVHCTPKNPCPTCQVRALLADFGLLGEFDELFRDWYEPATAGVLRISACEFSPRTVNALQNVGIETWPELFAKSEAELLRTQNFGRRSLNEVKEFARRNGWRWPSQ